MVVCVILYLSILCKVQICCAMSLTAQSLHPKYDNTEEIYKSIVSLQKPHFQINARLRTTTSGKKLSRAVYSYQTSYMKPICTVRASLSAVWKPKSYVILAKGA